MNDRIRQASQMKIGVRLGFPTRGAGGVPSRHAFSL